MAFPIMQLDYPNVKRTLRPPIPPYYHLGLIPAGHALRRSKHYLYPEGKAVATQKLTEWSSQNSFLEGKTYLDLKCHTVIVTAFFLEVLPPHASTWEGQTYTQVGEYPYLSSPRDILASIELYSLDELTSDAAHQVTDTEPAWQQTDLTTGHIELARLVEAADQIEANEEQRSITSTTSTCSQRFSQKQLTTLAEALYGVPYSVRRYTKRGAWDSTSWVYVLEPDNTTGKRFALEAQSHSNPAPLHRPPCSFITASTSYSFALLVEHKTMTTLWNAAHTPTKRLPKLLQKGIGRRAK